MRLSGFARYAWGVLAFNLFVVVWGAFVRASGSGAGCGSHWPLCNGEVVPRAAALETLIEFTHRTTSGVALIAVIVLFLWSRKAYPAGHLVRTGAILSLVFLIIEALLGAGLVLFELVADDASSFRAVSTIAHLVNTFVLTAMLTLTAWWASGGATTGFTREKLRSRLLGFALVGILVIGASGAIAALGDTLFPSTSLQEGLRNSFSPDSHPLIQLRKYHPLLAILVGLYVVGVARYLARVQSNPAVRRLAAVLSSLYVAQLLMGTVNIILLAPVAIQLLHLLLANLVWISLVLLSAATLLGNDGAGPIEPASALEREQLFASR
jgi:heme A synthase